MRDSRSDKIKVGPKEKLTLQILVPGNQLVVVLQDSTLQLALVRFQLAMVPKEILVESSPKVVAVLWKRKKCEVFEN